MVSVWQSAGGAAVTNVQFLPMFTKAVSLFVTDAFAVALVVAAGASAFPRIFLSAPNLACLPGKVLVARGLSSCLCLFAFSFFSFSSILFLLLSALVWAFAAFLAATAAFLSAVAALPTRLSRNPPSVAQRDGEAWQRYYTLLEKG